MERQLIHAAEQPAERDPIVSGEISPEHRAFVPIDESANGVADFFAVQPRTVELRANRLEGPLASLRPVDLTALGIELSTVFCDQSNADQINGVRPLYELGVEPILHVVSTTLSKEE